MTKSRAWWADAVATISVLSLCCCVLHLGLRNVYTRDDDVTSQTGAPSLLSPGVVSLPDSLYIVVVND